MEARSWSQPFGPVLAAPDPFLHRRLRVADAWQDGEGTWRALTDHSIAELWSILGFLRWYGPLLMRRDDEAAPAVDVDSYLASRPLVVAVGGELRRRGAVPDEDALGYLRTLGPAPWELPVAYTTRGRRSRARG
jgi:hypothetical protein